MTASGSSPREMRLRMPLPPSASFRSAGAGRRQLDQLVVEKRRARLEPPGHRHVVHPLDGVVDEHHLAVDAQRPVQRGARARGREVALDELARGIAGESQAGVHHRVALRMRAVDELRDVGARAASRRVGERRIPRVSGEDLVGALARLDDLHMVRHLLAEEVERDTVVGDHRLAHSADRGADRRQQPR